MDTALLTMMKRGAVPRREDVARLRGEVADAHALYAERGFLANPAAFHPAPAAPLRPIIRVAHARGLRYEWLTFPSEYVPDVDDAVGARWLGYDRNRTGHAWVLRHADPSRPWLICLHGLGTGAAGLDFPAFRAARLHVQLGYNLVFPVLPLHGPRRDPGVARGALLSFELIHTLHGLRQAVQDVRRLVGWARAQGAERVGMYGQSIGAYITALTSTLEPLDLVIAGIPLCDIPSLYLEHAPPRLGLARAGLFDDRLRELYGLVSPLRAPPLVPIGRRFVYGGLADRITTPAQATLLWEAWGRPRISWFHGGHVSFFWSREVAAFVHESLGGLVKP